MSDKYVLDKEGNPVPADLMTWANWYETAERVVKCDELPNQVRVSTVFLGIDHRFGGEGPPILWETMIFGGDQDSYQDRYTSREDALKGHEEALKLAKAAHAKTLNNSEAIK